jgi:predicted ATP-grasp superfamily ATP-dependent carboligase
MKLLIIGFSVRHIACSAARAGYSIAAADAFCDIDLCECASETFLLSRDGAMQSLQALVENVSPDTVVLGPGLEEASVRGVAVLNNPPERAALVSDKLWLARWLERRGFPFIKTEASVESIDFPAVIKPRKGAGGIGCRLVRSRADLGLEEGMIIQERIEGLPSSVSVIGNGREARAVATNEQIIGAAFAGAKDFRYSGNITPLEPSCPELAGMAEEIISELRLVGSNGVDFLLTEKGPVVVEVNPRFQGSLDTVELSTGLNIFKAHLEAFQGILPERPLPVPRRTAGRVIFYAQGDLKIGAELFLESLPDCLTDIPRPGSLIKDGDPVASILATGVNRADVLKLLEDRAAELHRALEAK